MLRQTKVNANFVVLAKGDEKTHAPGGGRAGPSGDGDGAPPWGHPRPGERSTRAEEAVEAAADIDTASPEESVWYQCTTAVKGLKGAGPFSGGQ